MLSFTHAIPLTISGVLRAWTSIKKSTWKPFFLGFRLAGAQCYIAKKSFKGEIHFQEIHLWFLRRYIHCLELTAFGSHRIKMLVIINGPHRWEVDRDSTQLMASKEIHLLRVMYEILS